MEGDGQIAAPQQPMLANLPPVASQPAPPNTQGGSIAGATIKVLLMALITTPLAIALCIALIVVVENGGESDLGIFALIALGVVGIGLTTYIGTCLMGTNRLIPKGRRAGRRTVLLGGPPGLVALLAFGGEPLRDVIVTFRSLFPF